LLDQIGVSDFNYYSAQGERAVHEALRAWPLLATVSRVLRSGASEPKGRPLAKHEPLETDLHVVETDEEPRR
jgi:hypothetical protein